MTICSESTPRRLPAAFHPALRSRVLLLMLWLMALATGLQAAPAPIANDFSDTEVLALLPAGFHDTPDTGNPDRLADRIQGHITRARTAGDPRHLGYAMALLEPWP